MNCKLLFRNLYNNEKLILFIFISLYLILELINIKLPGLYDDEALPAHGTLQIIKGIKPFFYSVKIFNINFPLTLAIPYETALECYILLPFLWLFGINAIILRSVPIFMGAFMLLFLYFFLKDFFDKKVALFTLFLLLINSPFLLGTKLGLDNASLLHFAGVAALWSLFRWYKGKDRRYFCLGIFLLSIGISIRVWFIWFFNGMIILALIFNRALYARMKGNMRKYIIIFIIIFLLGNFLFVYYNLISKFGTVQYIAQHFSETKNNIDNIHYFNNLKQRLSVFIDYLNGTWPFFLQGNWNNLMHLKEISANYFCPYIFSVAFIWLVLSSIFNKINFSKKRVSFILILFLLILLQSPFTLSSLGGPHLFILYPFIQIILSLSIVDIIKNFKKNKIIIAVIIFIVGIFVFSEFNNTVKNNYIYFEKTGGIGNNSDAIYSLSRYLEDEGVYKPIVMDWGIFHNLIFLSKGKIKPQIFHSLHEGRFKKEELLRYLKSSFKKRHIYIFHSQEFTNYSGIYPIFKEVIENCGKKLYEEKVFYQRDNRPVYIIYSVN